VLESRHLVGLFLGVVLLCGVFFTLGYVMGKTQYGGAVHADPLARILPSDRASDTDAVPEAAPQSEHKITPTHPAAPAADAPAAAPSASEWDFYTEKKSEHLASASKATPASPSRVEEAAPKTVPAAARFQAPRLVKGSIVLQIAALTRQGDALAMADELQQKKFPAFVVTPTTDNFYRVQVGPYPDEHAADAAKANLDHAGFKAITKR
jgi:cell division septation protein DedD